MQRPGWILGIMLTLKKKKKLISKAFTQYGSIYLTFSKWQNYRDKEQIRSYQDPLRLEGRAHLGGVAQGGPWWWWDSLHPDYGGGYVNPRLALNSRELQPHAPCTRRGHQLALRPMFWLWLYYSFMRCHLWGSWAKTTRDPLCASSLPWVYNCN